MAMRVLLGVLVAALMAACTGSGSTPATTPTTAAAPSSSTTTSTTAPPTTTTTTKADRLAEIQAIFQDLEERRLDALYRGDVEAFSALFANEAYLDRSLEAMEQVEFAAPPDGIEVVVESVLHDRPDCVAASVSTDYSQLLKEGEAGTTTIVIGSTDGNWGYSYVGEGWLCEGPHPLSG